MLIHVVLTEEIINDCLLLHYGDQPAGKKLRQRLFYIPIFLIVLGLYLIVDELRQPEQGLNFIMGFLYIGFAVSYYFFMKQRLMKAGKRLLKALGVNAAFTVEINDDEWITTTPTQQFTQPWSSFTGALISADNVMLYQANNSFTMFNHSFFSVGDFDVFKTHVREKVQPVVEA